MPVALTATCTSDPAVFPAATFTFTVPDGRVPPGHTCKNDAALDRNAVTFTATAATPDDGTTVFPDASVTPVTCTCTVSPAPTGVDRPPLPDVVSYARVAGVTTNVAAAVEAADDV